MAARLPVALITGTNSGVGLSLSVLLAANHQVFAGMRGLSDKKREALDKAAADAGVQGNITVLNLDVNSDESVESAVKTMLEATGGRCDVLVNNAGYSVAGGVEMLSMDQVKSQFETNVYGVIRCQKAVLPTMRKQRSGKIVNLSSVGGVWGQPFNDVYCASKFAIEGMAESQAAVFRTFGVRVTSVQPGAIKTAFWQNVDRPDMAKVPAEYHAPLQSTMAAYAQSGGAGQTPEEVAQVIIDKVISVDEPPLKVQTSEVIMPVVKGQLVDTTGEFGVDIAVKRFMPKSE
eukprot:CAMPEP_0201516816 /NCGR_PEP_ID=MMETSP0161_2-20130828/8067_1 /ASSEMBLY_ACC=CAM_ASM_000251 /TAXON_ID=180227 /ORGANISM="Neoparamoeba aestuarina, Strain SoJaBio B1-5/56/2" /LENGTH=288 /DNA_ID=CAMNT_0047914099 /DNA_START=152 /DNA_END=1018 /DNA_ORIENTATION=+